MNKAQKRKYVTAIGRMLKKDGFVKDKWGTFKKVGNRDAFNFNKGIAKILQSRV